MTEQTFTFTAEQIIQIARSAAENATRDRGWREEDTIDDVREIVNQGKPEAERASDATAFGWFNFPVPDWAKD